MQTIEVDGVRTIDKVSISGTLALPQKKRVSIGDVHYLIGHYKNGKFVLVYQTDITRNLDYLFNLHLQDYPNYEVFCFKVTSKIQRV